MCQARPGALGPDPRHADLGPQFLTMVPLLLDPKRFCAALPSVLPQCIFLSTRLCCLYRPLCLQPGKGVMSSSPKAAQAEAPASGPHPRFPCSRLHFTPVTGDGWGAPEELTERSQLGERSLGWGGEGGMSQQG